MKLLKYFGAATSVAWLLIFAATADAAVCSVPGDHPTIQSAASDAGCTTINVASGVYNENVNVTHTCDINGAQAGGMTDFATRSANSAGESIVKGAGPGVATPIFTINAPNVSIDGFTITNAVNTFSATGVEVKGVGNSSAIVNNIFDGISTNDTTSNGAAQAVYLSAGGADNVNILNNEMKNIHGNRSTKGVLVGDNGLTNNPSQGVHIEGNSIHDITSDTRGAYGVTVANVTNVSGLIVTKNVISKLNSTTGWVHGVGLEGDTPGAMVTDNDFSTFTNATPDKAAIWIESNPSLDTVKAQGNNFYLDATGFGVGVHPDLSVAFPNANVDATCNWWNSSTGPTTPSNPGGTGTKVSPNVTYSPWLTAPAPSAACFSIPAAATQCKGGGWMSKIRADGSTFNNQGDCIQYVNTGK